MAEARGATATTGNKMAMSRALGAAFLTHQVEQLEKTVTAGPGSRNWRERRPIQRTNHEIYAPNGKPAPYYGGKRTQAPAGPKVITKKVVEGEKERAPLDGKDIRIAKRDEEIRDERKEVEKDADIVVVDASVLVYGLGQMKRWCREGREEIVIVPLEALNTLDLLKKGTTNLAQRARTASRILEAQVGTNPRIRVQRDSAFVLWDNIDFQAQAPASTNPDEASPGNAPQMGSPEWLRCTISCAQWTKENAEVELAASTGPGKRSASPEQQKEKGKEGEEEEEEAGKQHPRPRVVLAVLSQTAGPPPSPPRPSAPAADSPVPLPAPHANKYEPRSSGALVLHWARRAGIDVFEVKPNGPTEPARVPDEDARRSPVHHGRRKPANAGFKPANASFKSANANYKPASANYKPANANYKPANANYKPAGPGYASDRDKTMVERPPAVKAMMDLVAQPSKVVRVLARGEKLEP
ncbi:hypothetical protein DENSPDRAFT_839765 [Dentipellis sp. KUC8613]|nr:hypothetical protein DENSPDRAFT_839765 [Dentipellis sp. KUC8613]